MTGVSSGWTRRVSVAPERLGGWLDRFRQTHGLAAWQVTGDTALLEAPDGAHALLHNWWQPVDEAASPGEFVRHLQRPRRVGMVLARKGAHAVGIAEGDELVASKVDRSYVQGRTKAGGWSQQRYARRRGNQADRAVEQTVERMLERLVPEAGGLDAIVSGGDAAFLRQAWEDRRLAELLALRSRHPVLAVPDPREAVLREFIGQMRAVPIDLDEAAQRRPR